MQDDEIEGDTNEEDEDIEDEYESGHEDKGESVFRQH